MNSRQIKYWQYLGPQISRALSQLDRRPFSKTFGCFDRKFWHQRITDFPSASQQQGVEILAHLWSRESDPLNKKQLLQWIEGAVLYTCKLQKWDGSFDEWYYNERGWAGPTAYILNSVFEAWKLTGDLWGKAVTKQFKTMFLRGAQFLIRHEEDDVLSNHQALAVLAIAQTIHLLGDDHLSEGMKKIKNRFLKSCNTEEGWSLEYDGADPGYQTATVSFLARLHELTGSKELEDLAKKQIEFISLFAFPDGSFARGVGSRATSVVFHFGLEYWSQWIPQAGRLAADMLTSLIDEKILGSHCQEDHYLIYRIPELLKAMAVAEDVMGPCTLPYEASHTNVVLEDAGLFALRKGDLYVVGNMKFGLRCLVFHVPTRKMHFQQGDIFLQSGEKLKTSGHCQADVKIEPSCIEIVTGFKNYKNPVFSPTRFLLFRIFFGIFGFHPLLAASLKKWIRKVLMFSGAKNEFYLERSLSWGDGALHVNTEVVGTSSDQVIYETAEFPSRYVPQSNYSFSGCQSRAQVPKRSHWSQEFACVQ